ncbi:MAG: PilW family protein [Pseudomonadota bacterium]|nr:PilW family protein [Pseudomonadota bacterium]
MKNHRGFSIVELMVAITLALIVTTGVISVFVGSRAAYQSTAGVGAVAEGGRFALDFLQQAVRNAGYMACDNTQKQISILNAATTLPFNFTQPLGGFEAKNTGGAGAYSIAAAPVAPDGATGHWAGTGLDPSLAAPPLVVQNTDVLVVRESLPNSQAVYVTAIVDGANNFTVNLQGSLVNGELAVISDCAKSAAMQITNISGGPANAVITHQAGGVPGNTASAFPVSFGIGSQVTPIDTIIYYIGQGADGDGALWAYDLNATNVFTATELVPDIEAMQILYGVDVNGTQTVGEYITADQVIDFNTVISVKIAVLAASQPGSRSIPAVAPTYTLLGNTVTVPRDSRARQVFEITIGVRNAAS